MSFPANIADDIDGFDGHLAATLIGRPTVADTVAANQAAPTFPTWPVSVLPMLVRRGSERKGSTPVSVEEQGWRFKGAELTSSALPGQGWKLQVGGLTYDVVRSEWDCYRQNILIYTGTVPAKT